MRPKIFRSCSAPPYSGPAMKTHSIWTKEGEKEVLPGFRPSSESSFPTESEDIEYSRLLHAEKRALQRQCTGNVHKLLAAVATHWKLDEANSSSPSLLKDEAKDERVLADFLSLALRVREGDLNAVTEIDSLDWRIFDAVNDAILERFVPTDPVTGALLTLGSLLHQNCANTCKPCIFFHRAKCFRGTRCSFCHFNHMNASGAIKGSKRLRPSKRTRELIKQINSSLAAEDQQNINNEIIDTRSAKLSF